MEDFNASLFREKIVFSDETLIDLIPESIAVDDNIVRSNRIFLKLGKGPLEENIVVRAQNMHTTLRLAGRVMFSHYNYGSFLGQSSPYNWEKQWKTVLSSYECEFNQDIWGSIYINGYSVFKTRKSPFMDIVEKCALVNVNNYDATVGVAESALKKVGRAMKVTQSSSVAAILSDSDGSMRCSIIQRSSIRNSTFSFTAEGDKIENRIVKAFWIVGDFLEALNLRFIIDDLMRKKKKGEFSDSSIEANQIRRAKARMTSLNKDILSFEDAYKVSYRPEKPGFF